MLNANRRHDKLLRRYLQVTRDRAEAQLSGSSSSRVQRLAVRERALAGAVRSIRLHLGLSDTFDPELESARLGIDGKRADPNTRRMRLSSERPEQELRPRIKPVPSAPSIARRSSEHHGRLDGALAVTVSDLLDFVASHDIDPDSEIVVRRLTGSHRNVDSGGRVNAVFIGLTDDGQVQLDIH